MSMKSITKNFFLQLSHQFQKVHRGVAQRPPIDAILGAYTQTGDSPYVHLCWMLHGYCNHRCSYCNENNWNGSMKHLKLNEVIHFLEKFIAHYLGHRLKVSFSGGEVTYWPHFLELVKWLKNQNIEVGITSNGSRGPEYFQRLAPLLSWLNISYHPEFSREERFIETLKAATPSVPVTVRLMMHPDPSLWQRSFAFGERLKTIKDFGSLISVEYAPLAENFGDPHPHPMNYAEEQKNVLTNSVFEVGPEKNLRTTPPIEHVYSGLLGPPVELKKFDVNSLLAQGKTNFMGWKCQIGREQIFVDDRGDVFRAGCNVGGKIGHISDRHISFPRSSIRCDKTYCHCGTDILVTKVSPQWELHQELKKIESLRRLKAFKKALAFSRYHYSQFGPTIFNKLKYSFIPISAHSKLSAIKGLLRHIYRPY